MDLIEVIAPIIFVLIFGLGKVFEKLQEQGSKGSQKPRQTVDGEESSGGQDIWEAVRRRIEERTVIESEKPLPPVWLEEAPEPEVQPSAPPPPPPALVRKKPTKPVGLPTSVTQKSSQSIRDQLELKDPASLRRAFLYREILGPPVALRRAGEQEI